MPGCSHSDIRWSRLQRFTRGVLLVAHHPKQHRHPHRAAASLYPGGPKILTRPSVAHVRSASCVRKHTQKHSASRSEDRGWRCVVVPLHCSRSEENACRSPNGVVGRLGCKTGRTRAPRAGGLRCRRASSQAHAPAPSLPPPHPPAPRTKGCRPGMPTRERLVSEPGPRRNTRARGIIEGTWRRREAGRRF